MFPLSAANVFIAKVLAVASSTLTGDVWTGTVRIGDKRTERSCSVLRLPSVFVFYCAVASVAETAWILF